MFNGKDLSQWEGADEWWDVSDGTIVTYDWELDGDGLFDADLVAFDKDGTLIDFEFLWGRLAIALVGTPAASGIQLPMVATGIFSSVSRRTERNVPAFSSHIWSRIPLTPLCTATDTRNKRRIPEG